MAFEQHLRRMATVALMGMAGCSVINEFEDPLAVGKWQLKSSDDTKMQLELDGSGDAKLFYAIMGVPVTEPDEFDIDWEQDGRDEFKVKYECTASVTGCDNNNPELRCKVNTLGTRLECTTEHLAWANYPFEWKQD